MRLTPTRHLAEVPDHPVEEGAPPLGGARVPHLPEPEVHLVPRVPDQGPLLAGDVTERDIVFLVTYSFLTNVSRKIIL